MIDPLEIYYHDPSLAQRLEVMAHWRLTPKQIKKLSDDDLDAMTLSYRVYEKRQIESLSDLIGMLTGTSWDVESLTADTNPNEHLDDSLFTWSQRPKRLRVSLPLSIVVGGKDVDVLEHVKKVASDMKAKHRKDPSILSLPSSDMLKDTEIVDLSKVSKEEFIRFTKNVVSKYGN